MKFIKFVAILSCLFFACTDAFAADEVIQINLTAGSYLGSPSTFYVNKTQKKFCAESTCETTLTQLSALPATPISALLYVGTVINGIPLIDREGKFINSYIFQMDLSESSYSAQNLFRSDYNIELVLTGTNASPTSITMNSGSTMWINSETGNQILKLTTLPTTDGKKFLAFSTTENLNDAGALIAIDGNGNILSSAESLYGIRPLYALWEKVSIVCNSGEFLPNKSSSCKTCTTDYWCPGGTFFTSDYDQGLNRCGDGQTSLQGSDSADDCYIPNKITCVAGQYMPSNTNTCTACLYNNWCPGGEFIEFYNTDQGLTACKYGTITLQAGSDSEDDCKAQPVSCPAGEFLPMNTMNCEICSETNWCPGGIFTWSSSDQGINKCPTDTTSPNGSDSADDCKSESSTVTCAAGQYLPNNSSICVECFANNWCPGGTFTESDITQGLNSCDEGMISGWNSDSADDCHIPASINCAAGQYLPNNSSICEECAANNWCPGGVFSFNMLTSQGITFCGQGSTSESGSDSADDCSTSQITCAAGQYLPNNLTTCAECFANNWCPGGVFSFDMMISQGITWCGLGSTSASGSDSADDCSTSQITCAAGQYLPNNILMCLECSANNWCPGGIFTWSSSDQGINKCPTDTTSPNNSDSEDDCINSGTILCNPGNFLPKNTLLCTPCSPNYWCPGGNFSENIYDQGLNNCPAGTVCNFGQMEESSCHTPTTITCSAGNYLKYGKCEKCPKDSWCPGGDFTETYTSTEGLNKCSSGETSPEGSDSADDCKSESSTVTCAAGRYLPKNSLICTKCYANHWCPGGTFSKSTYDQGTNSCSEGMISPYGSSSIDNCHIPATVNCNAGYFFDTKSFGCNMCFENHWCPGGNFNESYIENDGIYGCLLGQLSPKGSDSEDDCKMLETINCPAGTWLPAYSSSCQTCLKDNWCKGGNFYKNYSSGQGLAACNFGLISDEGSDEDSDCHEPDSGMVVCQPGNYLPANSENCSPCQSNNWCPGGIFPLDTLDQGTNICPNDGKSYYGTKSISSCYKDLLPIVIPHGTGDQTCYYGTAGYTENCKLYYVTSCDGGYYAEKSSAGKGYETGCIVVGYNYYSPQNDLNRYNCPLTKNGIKGETETETSSDINQCSILSTIYTTGSGDIINGIGLTECSYSATTKGYGIAEIMNRDPLILPKGPITDPLCSSDQKIVFCFGGYFLENDSGLECSPVGDGYYSPRPNYSEMTGCIDKSDNCPYEFDVEDYQLSRGRETCPATYPHSELPRTSLKKCYKDCTLDVPNSVSVTPIKSKIFYASGGKGEPEPVCQFNVECNTGYKAVDNGTGNPSCKLDGSVCQNDPNAVESDTNCIPTKCKDTYHLENKKCIENVVSCPIENGLGRKEWMKDNILGGKWTMCTAYKCNPGYTSERYLTNETSKPCGECKNRRDASGNIVVSAWKETNCEIATCMYQGELYRYDNNKCIQICDTAGREDITGKMIWDPLSEKCERSCNPGFTNW